MDFEAIPPTSGDDPEESGASEYAEEEDAGVESLIG